MELDPPRSMIQVGTGLDEKRVGEAIKVRRQCTKTLGLFIQKESFLREFPKCIVSQKGIEEEYDLGICESIE